jgi:phosphoglycerate dehydrogenase-like enzyme
MSEKPTVLLSPHFRTLDEIFDPLDLKRLASFSHIAWGRDEPLPEDEFETLLPDVWAYVSTRHAPYSGGMNADRLARAPKLRALIEVSGGFAPGIDYDECFKRGIRVLSCAPAFGPQVAEMALGMAIAGGRGLVAEHEAFRQGEEVWQNDPPERDFTLYGKNVGFVGFGSLARNLLPLLKPFGVRVRAFDPWLPDAAVTQLGCVPASLDEVLTKSRIVFVLALPTPANRGLLSREKLSLLQQNTLLLLISRSHLVDFDALTDLLVERRFQAAIDVFPGEPHFPTDHPIRKAPGVILSAHRAASIRLERRAIGRMVVDDLELMARGLPPTQLQIAEPELIRLRLNAS